MPTLPNNTSLPDKIFYEFSEDRQRRMNALAMRTQKREEAGNELEHSKALTEEQERDLVRLYKCGGRSIVYDTRTMENLAKKGLVSHIPGRAGSWALATRFELTDIGREKAEEIEKTTILAIKEK